MLVAMLVLILSHSSITELSTPRLAAAGSGTSLYMPIIFKACPPPFLDPINDSDGDGSYTVWWSLASCQPSHTSWELQHDQNAGFGSPTPIAIANPSQTSYSASTPTPGTYYWRVRAFRPGQGWSAWSNVQSVTVRGAEVWVDNDTGGTLTIEIVGIEKKSFSPGFHFWRSVTPGTYTVKAWGCGSSLQRSWYLEPGENVMAFYCGHRAAQEGLRTATN
jgi:hypothetical protein